MLLAGFMVVVWICLMILTDRQLRPSNPWASTSGPSIYLGQTMGKRKSSKSTRLRVWKGLPSIRITVPSTPSSAKPGTFLRVRVSGSQRFVAEFRDDSWVGCVDAALGRGDDIVLTVLGGVGKPPHIVRYGNTTLVEEH